MSNRIHHQRERARCIPGRYVLAGAAVGVSAAMGVNAAVAGTATLPSVTFDLRVAGTGGKEATVTNVGDVVELELYVITRGLNDIDSNDSVNSAQGSFRSSTGGLLGDLAGLRPPAPYDSPFQLGNSHDHDGDGDLDVGPVDPYAPGPFDYYYFRVPPLPPPQPPGGQFVGRAQFTLRTPAEETTEINWLLKPDMYSVLAWLDGSTLATRNDPATLSVQYAAPVVIRGLAGPPSGEVEYLSGTHAHLTISKNSRVAPGQVLTITQGINIVPGGTLDHAGGLVNISVNDATSGNSGGTLLTGAVAIGTTSAGMFTQSGGYSRVGSVSLGTVGSVDGKLMVTGGTFETAGPITVEKGALHVTGGGGVVKAATLDLFNGSTATIEGGALTTSGGARIGAGGAGTFTVRGGEVGIGNLLEVGSGNAFSPARGLLSIEGGTLSAWRTQIGSAKSGGSIGQGQQTGGTFNAGGVLIGSADPSDPSTFHLADGILRAATLGIDAGGVFTQSGGQLIVASSFNVIGATAGPRQYAISGGSLDARFGFVSPSNSGPIASTGYAGEFVQSGGNVRFDELRIDADATYEALGGTLAIGRQLRLAGAIDFGGAGVPVSFADNVLADFTKGELRNAGSATFTAGAGSLMSFASQQQLDGVGTIETQGLIHVAGQALTIPQNQSVGGSGTIEGDVTNQGLIAPGQSPGAIVINGDYTQADGAAIAIEIAGLLADEEFDTLTVSGAASIDGFLNVSLLDGFVPQADDRFTVLAAGSLSGAFDNVVGGRIAFADGWFDVAYAPSSVTLTNFTPVPEPAGGIALLAALVGIAGLRRRRRGAALQESPRDCAGLMLG